MGAPIRVISLSGKQAELEWPHSQFEWPHVFCYQLWLRLLISMSALIMLFHVHTKQVTGSLLYNKIQMNYLWKFHGAVVTLEQEVLGLFMWSLHYPFFNMIVTCLTSLVEPELGLVHWSLIQAWARAKILHPSWAWMPDALVGFACPSVL